VTLSVKDVGAMERDEAGRTMSDVYSSGREFPVVVIGGAFACEGGIDMDAVLAAAGQAFTAEMERDNGVGSASRPDEGDPQEMAG
jgi:hypothetical protein